MTSVCFQYLTLKKWIQQFPLAIPVKAGEELKSLSQFEVLVKRIEKSTQGIQRQQFTLVAFGGGSVGDTVGFLASVLKRGVPWVNIPSTWISAIDSAHGGKTALNIGSLKNVVGSFYAPTNVVLFTSLLARQPERLLNDAYGEIAKTVLLRPSAFKNELEKGKGSLAGETCWQKAASAYRSKNQYCSPRSL